MPVAAPALFSKAAISIPEMGSRTYPRDAVDSNGFRVRIAKPPRRIVSQYWSIDEYLYAVVPPERVVGVSESAYVRGASNLSDLIARFHPVIAADPEQILRQSPDLVLVSADSSSDLSALLSSSGIPVFRMFIDFRTLDQIEEYIRLTGYLTGEDERAEAVAQRFRAEVKHAQALRKQDARAPRVLGMSGDFCYGSHTLFDDIVKTVGGSNVASANGLQGYELVNTEQIVRWNPEWIVTGADADNIERTKQRLLADPAIQLTDAARSGHVLVLDNRVFLPMSPFASRRVTALAEALWK